MISIKVSTRGLAIAKERLVKNANRRYRDIIYKMFSDVLTVSAQYSGDYVSNWQIVTQNDGLPSYNEWPLKHSVDISQHPAHAGDPLAIGYARSQMVRKPFSYTDKVYFVNATPLHFTETTVTGPDGKEQKLRPENIIDGGILLKSYLSSKYGGRF